MKFKLFLEQSEQPIVAYHGSPSKIDAFSINFSGEGHDQEGPGIYFTTDPKDAEGYGNYVHKVLLKPRKLVPLKGRINKEEIKKLILNSVNLNNEKELINMNIDDFWESPLSDFDEKPYMAFQNAFNSVIQYSTSPHDAFQNVWYTHYRKNPQKYLQAMVGLGYDGVEVPRTNWEKMNLKHYIIFNPSIIQVL